MSRLALILPALALLTHPAPAQDLAALERAEQALRAVWDATPLTLRDVALVTDVEGYGVYTPRPDAVFGPVDTIRVYVAPAGYGWAAVDGGWQFGLSVDLAILSPEGEVLLDMPAFGRSQIVSLYQNTEYHMVITVNLTSAPPGDYLLAVRLTDIVSAERADATVPFQITP